MTQPIDRLDPRLAQPDAEQGLDWYDIRDLGVEGRAFADTESFYDRLPARAKGSVPEAVWSLSLHTAGLRVRFLCDAANIAVRWKLRFPQLAMTHMPASGVSGLDLYARDAGGWRFVGVARPETFPVNEVMIGRSLKPERREYLLSLPLYNGVEEVRIGIARGALLAPAGAWDERRRRPMLFYGTSVVQGGCASRPGMAHAAILSRRLDRPFFNLGFSGSGRCEPELARLLAELDPCVYVVDALPNMDREGLAKERLGPFVRVLRAAHPATPIVLVEHFRYVAERFIPWMRDMFPHLRRELHGVIEELRAEGVAHLLLLPGDGLYGADGEATVDGTHPTDLGFARLADAHEPLLRGLLGLSG
jgi:hypothetical protein